MLFNLGRRFAPLLLLSVAGLPCALAAPPRPQARPATAAKASVPQATQHIPHWIPNETHVQKIVAVTPRQVVLQIVNYVQPSLGRILVLDRRTGSLQIDFSTEGVSLRQQSLSAFWQSLGAVESERGGSVIVLQRSIQSTNLPGLPSTQFEIYGFGETGYPPRWMYPAKPGDPPNEAINGVAVAGGLLVLRSHTGTVLLWDALTGTPIDTKTPEGNAHIQEAIRLAGTPLVPLGLGALYRLDTGKQIPAFQDLVGDQSVTPGGVTTDRALWTISGDTGFMGSSTRPNVLVCTDGQGKKIWQFPDPVIDPHQGEFGTAKNADDAQKLFRSVGNVTLATPPHEEAVAVVEASGYVYGIRVRDGKTLWTQSYPAPLIALTAVGNAGVFVLRGQYNPLTGARKNLRLELLDVATGARRRTWPFTSPATWLGAVGDDLMTVDNQGNLHIYTGKQSLK